MPDAGKLTSVPLVPPLSTGTVGQQAPNVDQPRDRSGTADLKALAFKVLQRAKSEQARDSGGTEVSQTPLSETRTVGQSHGSSGAAWGPQDWSAFFHERAAIREYDGHQTHLEAERRAIDETVQHWLALNPPPASEPQDGCIVCGDGGDDLLPYLARTKAHFWLHLRCRPAFDKARRALALDVLGKMILGLPTEPREALEELLDGGER